MKERIYICHTYYHVYISMLKELRIREEILSSGNEYVPGATVLLSTLSNKFESLGKRLMATGIFEDVRSFEEHQYSDFPELLPYKEDSGSFVRNMFRRIQFTRRFADKIEPYVPVNLKEYGEVNVFCDSDPIGYYLNRRHIRYHAIEDGLDCLHNYDSARFDNRGHFKIKVFFSKKLNLIFIQNGYGRYCIDMEVNNRSALKYDADFYREVPRKQLTERLTDEDKTLLLRAFVRNMNELTEALEKTKEGGDRILVLTDPLCSLDIRKQIFGDIIETYSKEGRVFLKPHPRDELDYAKEFPEVFAFDGTVPMEMLNFLPNARFKKVVAVLTMVGAIEYADEVVRLGESFMDKYEKPEIHRQNEAI